MLAVEVNEHDNDDDGSARPSPSSYQIFDGIDAIPSSSTHVKVVAVSSSVIPPDAFGPNLRGVVLPDGLRRIERHAFRKCARLEWMEMPDTVNRIDVMAFRDCALSTFRVPSAMTEFDLGAFGGRKNSLVSIEIPRCLARLTCTSAPPRLEERTWTELCYLRNVAFPSGGDVDERAMTCMTGLKGALFPNDNEHDHMYNPRTVAYGMNAIQRRFAGLPIHDICYGQCHRDVDAVMRDLRREINPWSSSSSPGGGGAMFPGRPNATGKVRDCLGMTPLHILTCSSRHDIDMYRLLVTKYPENLVTMDGWGDVPLLYAFWCDAPGDVIRYLVESYETMHPGYVVDWTKMVRTLAEGRAPPSRLRNLLDARGRYFPSRDGDRRSSSSSSSWRDELRDVISGLAISHDLRASTFRGPRTSASTFRYLLCEVVSYRIESCRIGRWRSELTCALDGFREGANDWESRTNEVYAMLDLCESIKDSAAILELALWKARMIGGIGDDGDRRRCRTKKMTRLDKGAEHGRRERCRINCGADVVVRNVLPYLWTDMGMRRSSVSD